MRWHGAYLTAQCSRTFDHVQQIVWLATYHGFTMVFEVRRVVTKWFDNDFRGPTVYNYLRAPTIKALIVHSSPAPPDRLWIEPRSPRSTLDRSWIDLTDLASILDRLQNLTYFKPFIFGVGLFLFGVTYFIVRPRSRGSSLPTGTHHARTVFN